MPVKANWDFLNIIQRDVELTLSDWCDADFEVPITDQVGDILLKVWNEISPDVRQVYRMQKISDEDGDYIDFALARVMHIAACIFDGEGQPRLDEKGKPISFKVITDSFLGMASKHKATMIHRMCSTMRHNTLNDGGPNHGAIVSEMIKILRYEDGYKSDIRN